MSAQHPEPTSNLNRRKTNYSIGIVFVIALISAIGCSPIIDDGNPESTQDNGGVTSASMMEWPANPLVPTPSTSTHIPEVATSTLEQPEGFWPPVREASAWIHLSEEAVTPNMDSRMAGSMPPTPQVVEVQNDWPTIEDMEQDLQEWIHQMTDEEAKEAQRLLPTIEAALDSAIPTLEHPLAVERAEYLQRHILPTMKATVADYLDNGTGAGPVGGVGGRTGPGPDILGSYGGECDRGPTSILLASEIALRALPTTTLYYNVAFVEYAAEWNGYETEECSHSTGQPPVHYGLRIRSVDDLKVYAELTYRDASALKLDRILAND